MHFNFLSFVFRNALSYLAAATEGDILFFSFGILFVFFLLIAVYYAGYWITKKQYCPSPYTKSPLRLGASLPPETVEQILRYLFKIHQYDNRMFDLRKAAFCRQTGRIFQGAVWWFDTIHVDWSFLRKRYPGNWISWGSLTDNQKEALLNFHHTLKGFQTEYSSENPSPRAVEERYAFLKPGPLYVDLETKILLGWKCVPDTDFEVLIVQKPKGKFELKKD